MLNSLAISNIWVLDYDDALDFYVGKLGLEIHSDADLEFMRWLTVNVPGQEDRELLLSVPAAPMMDEESAAQVRELVSKGAFFGAIFQTVDCRATYAELVAKGVEFTQEPEERFYGVDCGLRDPFGNGLRITQPAPPERVAAALAEPGSPRA
jgi:catechol 2,3-dioxygenase-like lactoylglutathione lyase family enzyme